jgi:hypothetical protein
MPANINFTAFTDPNIFFANKAAANQFFAGLTVSNATLAAPGVVTQMANIPLASLPALQYVTVNILMPDGSVNATQVVSKASSDALYAAVLALVTNLQNAGIMPPG